MKHQQDIHRVEPLPKEYSINMKTDIDFAEAIHQAELHLVIQTLTDTYKARETSLTEQLMETNNRIENYKAEQKNLETTLKETREDLQKSEEELTSLKNSTSWKLTRPLRFLARRWKVDKPERVSENNRLFPTIEYHVPQQAKSEEVIFAEPPSVNGSQILTPSREHSIPGLAHLVSFVIPTYNAGPGFADLLEALSRQQGLSGVEIVVVDSGSTDETLQIAGEKGVVLIQIPNWEFSHSYARNLGARHAKGSVLCFLTQDVMPTGDWWARRILEALHNHGAVAATCAEQPRADASLYSRIGIDGHAAFMEIQDSDRIGSMPPIQNYQVLRKNAQLSDVACFIWASVFCKYEYRGAYAEDLDLGLRLIRDKYTVAFISSEKIIHSHNRQPFYYFRRALVDVKWVHHCLPDMPLWQGEADTLLSMIFNGCRQLSGLRKFILYWSNPDGDGIALKQLAAQTSAYLCAIDRIADADKILSTSQLPSCGDAQLDKVLSELQLLQDSTQVLEANMAVSFSEYLQNQILPFMEKNNIQKIRKKECMDIIEALENYYASSIGGALGAYGILHSEEHDLLELIHTYSNGI